MKNIRVESNKKSKILSSFIISYYFFAPDYFNFCMGLQFNQRTLPKVFTPPSGWGLVIPVFFSCCFFSSWSLSPDSWVSLSQTVIDRKLMLHCLPARLLSDRNIYCTLREGEQQQGKMPPGLFLLPLIKYLRQVE